MYLRNKRKPPPRKKAFSAKGFSVLAAACLLFFLFFTSPTWLFSMYRVSLGLIQALWRTV